MQRRTALAFVSAIFWMQAPLALADPFIDDRTGVADDYFHQSFANHNNSLDNLGSSMRSDHDYSNLNAAHSGLTQAQSNQLNTWQTSQDSFSNTQSQAVLSGGLHNGNGSNGSAAMMNGGLFGASGQNQVSPDSWGAGGYSGGSSVYGSGNYYGGSSGVYGDW